MASAVRTVVALGDEALAAVVADVLEHRRHRWRRAADADTAVALAAAEPLDLAILEQVGNLSFTADTLRRLRQRQRNPRLTVLVAVPDPRPEIVQAVLEAGADDFLAPPHKVGDVEARVAVTERWALSWRRGGKGFDAGAGRLRESQLRETIKMEALADLSTGIANDFNNALAAISGSLELAWMYLEPGQAAARQELAVARGAAHRAARLVRRLYACSHPAPSVRRPVDPGAIVCAAVDLLRCEFESWIAVEAALDHGDWSVSADFEQICDLLLNLGYNARDAMPDGGVLRFATARVQADEESGAPAGLAGSREFVRIDVSDTGTGIPHGVLPHIFEPFFTTKRSGRGAGLGLAMVYGVLRQHLGGVTVETTLGEGTTFHIFLPRSDEESDATPATPETMPRGTGETVLVVDDEVDLRHAMREALEQLHYTVLEARDGDEGLEVLRHAGDEVRLVLLDVVMPRHSGWDALAAMRLDRPAVRVIMTSGTLPPGAASPDGHQVQGLLRKPFSLAELAREVRRVLDSPD